MFKVRKTYRKEYFLALLLYLAISLNYVYFDMFHELGGNFKDCGELERIELVDYDNQAPQRKRLFEISKYFSAKTVFAHEISDHFFKLRLRHYNRYIFHRFKNQAERTYIFNETPCFLRTINISHQNQDEDAQMTFC